MQTIREVTRHLVQKYELDPWFLRIPKGRPYAWDCIQYINEHCPTDAKILELGCGIGQNLVELWRHGFRDLHGIENDIDIYRACRELLKHFDVDAGTLCSDAQDLPPWKDFDVVAPLNFTYRKEINMKKFLGHVRSILKPGGLLIIDIIDPGFPKKKAPEYVHRYTEKQFVQLAEGYTLKEVWHRYFPRSIYIMEKTCTR